MKRLKTPDINGNTRLPQPLHRSTVNRLKQLAQARQQMQRRRWYWIIGGFLLYLLIASISVDLLQAYSMSLAVSINLVVLFFIIAGLILVFARRYDHMIAEAEQAEIERTVASVTAHQLEAVQATARAVAHNINQPLTAALGYLSLYESTEAMNRDEQDLQAVRREIERVAALVQQLQRVTQYQTVPYAGGAEMLDLSPNYETTQNLYR